MAGPFVGDGGFMGEIISSMAAIGRYLNFGVLESIKGL
jgi:hypothetical protein